jgi:isopentenyldiphosphate isomerase
MHENELWQVFHQNGQPVQGEGALDDAFDKDSDLVVGNAHVWLWRRTADDTIEVLLQKRAMTKKRKPGYYHISAGGHINLHESAIDAAMRETKEEMGITINPDQLYFVHVTRMPPNWNDLAHVYIYQLRGDETFSFDDGEVDSVQWHPIETFERMTNNTAAHKLVDSGGPYFRRLIETIRRQAAV